MGRPEGLTRRHLARHCVELPRSGNNWKPSPLTLLSLPGAARSLPTNGIGFNSRRKLQASVAPTAEQLPCKEMVAGSNPCLWHQTFPCAMDADETSNLVVQGPTPWQGPTRGRWNGPGIPNPRTASSTLARESKHNATLAQLADALLSKGK